MRAADHVLAASTRRSEGRHWLDVPRSTPWSIASWLLATVVFVSATLILGGPSQADSSQSVYSALLLAHGDWACAYPSAVFSHVSGASLTFTSPVYTLVSALAAWVLRIGSGVSFPPASDMGVTCSHAMTLVASWTASHNALTALLRVGFVAWLVLVGGICP